MDIFMLSTITGINEDVWEVFLGTTYKAFCSIVHVAELEALLVSEGIGQSFAQTIRRQRILITVLDLGKHNLAEETKGICIKMKLKKCSCHLK